MKKAKRYLAILLCIVMCISLFPPTGAFAEGEEAELLENEAEQEETVVAEPAGEEPLEEVPAAVESVEEKPVEAIVEEVQKNNSVDEQIEDSNDNAETVTETVTVVKRTVIFNVDPAGAEIAVYSFNDNGERVYEQPNSNGVYELLPGDYYYDVNCQDYESVESQKLTVEDDEQALEVAVVLTSVVVQTGEAAENLESDPKDDTLEVSVVTDQEQDNTTEATASEEMDTENSAIETEGKEHASKKAMNASNAENIQKIQNALTALAAIQDGKYFANEDSNGQTKGSNNTYWTQKLKEQVQQGDYISYLSPSVICNHDNASTCKCLPFNGAAQCDGFQRYLRYVLYGDVTMADDFNTLSLANRENITLSDLQPGDVFDLDFGYPHYVTVWKIEGNTLYVVHANHLNYPCKIMYGTYNLNYIKNNATIWRRLKDYSKINNFVQPGSGSTTPTPPSYSNVSNTTPTDTKVTISAKLSYSTNNIPTYNGLYMGTSQNELKKVKLTMVQYGSGNTVSSTDQPIASNTALVNAYNPIPISIAVGGGEAPALNPGTTYYYQLWATDSSGTEYRSALKSFTTTGTAISYSITYNANGGTGAPSAQTKYKDVTLPLSSQIPTRGNSSATGYTVTLDANGGSVNPASLTASRTTSYTFKNWNTKQNGSGTSFDPGDDYTLNEANTLWAQWNSTTTTSPVTLPTPTRTGYDFQGWATSTTATSGLPAGSYTPTGTVTLHAIWKAKAQYTITFNANGGSSVNSMTVTQGESFTIPSSTRAGYAFSGWNVKRSDNTWYVSGQGWLTEAEITSGGYSKAVYQAGKTYTMNDYWTGGVSGLTFTFYAIWSPYKLTMQYNTNGGTIGANSNNFSEGTNGAILRNGNTTVSTWTYGTTYTGGLINDATFGLSREGYTFTGWCLNADGSTTVFDQNTDLNPENIYPNLKNGNATVTLYAIWQKDIPLLYVYYFANGGTITSDHYFVSPTDEMIMVSGDPYYMYTEEWVRGETKPNGLANASDFGLMRDGYSFAGWSASADGSSTVFSQDDISVTGEAINPQLNNIEAPEFCISYLYAIWQKDAVTENSIEVIAPSGDALGNSSAEIKLRLSVTPETAEAGYCCFVEISTDPEFNYSVYGEGFGLQTSYNAWNAEVIYAGNFFHLVPGATYYVRANISSVDGEGITASDTVSFTTVDSKEGLIKLELDNPFTWYSEDLLYFTADESGYYFLDTNGSGIYICDAEGNYNYPTDSIEDGRIMITPMAAGETLYFYGGSGTLTVSKYTAGAGTENSIEVIAPSGDALGNMSAEIKLRLSVTPETAEAGYSYYLEISTDPEFNSICDAYSGPTSYIAWNAEVILAHYSSVLVPGTTYYVSAYIMSMYGEELAASDTVSFTTVNSKEGMTKLERDNIFTLNSSDNVAFYYTAEENSFYCLDVKDFWGNICDAEGKTAYVENGKRIVSLAAGETLYVYGYGYEGSTLIISKYTAGTENSISVIAPSGDALGNMSADIQIRLSVTPETAENGYNYGVQISTDLEFVSIVSGFGDFSHNAYNAEVISSIVSDLVPGATYYVRAYITVSRDEEGEVWEEIAASDTVSFTTVDSRDGMIKLELDNTFTAGSYGNVALYFTADESNYYCLEAAYFGGTVYDAEGSILGNTYENNKLIVSLSAGETVYLYGYGSPDSSVSVLSEYEAGTENSIEIIPPQGVQIGNTTADIEFSVNTTPEFAVRGYDIYLLLSTREQFDRDTENVTEVEFGERKVAYLNEKFSCSFDDLVPNVKYYVKGILSACDGSEEEYKSDVVSFTTVDSFNSPTQFTELKLGIPAENLDDRWFYFKADSSDCFVASNRDGDYLSASVFLSDGLWPISGLQTNTGVFFHLNAGETVYLHTYGSDWDTITVNPAENVLSILQLGTTNISSGVVYQFAAPTTGLYRIQEAGTTEDSMFIVYDNGGWVLAENGSLDVSLKSGEIVYLMEEYNGTAIKITAEDPVVEYVKRCYLLLMGREGDAGGVNYWVNQLKSGAQGGASIVDSFVSSKEFENFHLSNEGTVARIYQTMLNREPDSGGLAYWKSFMDDGTSAHYIVNGFSGAEEFKNLCGEYGITPGRITLTQYRDRNLKVTQFVNRNYLYALERSGDAGGLNYWCEKIIRKQQTPQQCAQNFVFSQECVNRNLSNEEFVKMLYRLYMGREADQGGLNYWLGQMGKGMKRQAVANSFANSKEFKGIVASYGL